MEQQELTLKKKNYRSKIAVYVKRRVNLKKKYGAKSKRYISHSRKINAKLSSWRRAIKRIEVWEEKIKTIDGYVEEYIGVSAKYSNLKTGATDILAKKFLCRYCLENGINGAFVRSYVGSKGNRTMPLLRMRFIKQCQKNRALNNQWRNFKLFILEQKQTA